MCKRLWLHPMIRQISLLFVLIIDLILWFTILPSFGLVGLETKGVICLSFPIIWIFFLTEQCNNAIKELLSGNNIPISELSKINREDILQGDFDGTGTFNNMCKRKDVPGIVVFHNITDNKYYVGQSLTILRFTFDQLKKTSVVNKDLSVDIQLKDVEVSIIPMTKDYGTLNDMEEEYIEQYDAIQL